jgi:hypothetical protein
VVRSSLVGKNREEGGEWTGLQAYSSIEIVYAT